MTEAIVLLSVFALILAYLAWNARCKYYDLLAGYNSLLKDYEESTRNNREQRDMLAASEREAWRSYARAFKIAIEESQARSAAEELAKNLKSQLEEMAANLAAAESAASDTEIYEEEVATRKQGAADAEPGTPPEGCLAVIDSGDTRTCCGVGRCSER